MTAPLEFLVPERFDIPAKTLYARFRELGLESDWGRWVYAHHLKVWNGFHERKPEKNGFEAYRSAFDAILDAMKGGEFDFARNPIRINQAGVPLNGSHRLAAALVHGKSMPPESFTIDANARAPAFPYSFFRDKTDIVPGGLEVIAADAMALEYCRLRAEKRDLYVVSVFPSASGKEKSIQKILERHGRVVYRKEVALAKNGSIHLIYQIYPVEKWVGSASNGFKGAQYKAGKCFEHAGPVRAYLVQAENIEEMNSAKQKIRDLFGIANHSVHINNTFEETLHIARLLFNENSIHFLNVATLRPSFKRFWRYLKECAEAVKERGLDAGEFCIAGSAPMAAFGLRDVEDFDYLHGRRFSHRKLASGIKSHEGWTHFYHLPPDDIVHNPRNHFYFHGMHFATLDVVREMKVKRWEKKDKRDVAMIAEFENETRQRQTRPPSLPPLTWAARSLKKLFRKARFSRTT